MKKVRERNRRNLALVLSGGGARGAFQVGVYERLRKDPRFADGPMVLSGTSAGAINAALIAAGRTPRQMMRFWNRLGTDPPVVVSPLFFRSAVETLARLAAEEAWAWLSFRRSVRPFLQRLQNHMPPARGDILALIVEFLLTARFDLVSRFLDGVREPFLADTAPLRDRLVEEFGGETVPAGEHRLAINTVDAHTGRIVRYVTHATPHTRSPDYIVVDEITVDMVLASASIPLLFPAVPIGRQLLWDGGLLVNTPLAPAIALGADEIVTVLVTEPPDPDPGPFTGLGRALERTVDSLLENGYNVDRKLLLERNRLAHLKETAYRGVKLYEAVRPERNRFFTAGSYLYFEPDVLAEMYALGRKAAAAWLAAGPRVDRLETTLRAA